jgi:dimeric dUTPase (all-alpha-NTP-PPase superfamily)
MQQQASLQILLFEPMGKGEQAIKENTLALIVEATELLQETNWKPWRTRLEKMNRAKVSEELVDIFKFCFNIANELGLTEEEFDLIWDEKHQKVKQRFKDGY